METPTAGCFDHYVYRFGPPCALSLTRNGSVPRCAKGRAHVVHVSLPRIKAALRQGMRFRVRKFGSAKGRAGLRLHAETLRAPPAVWYPRARHWMAVTATPAAAAPQLESRLLVPTTRYGYCGYLYRGSRQREPRPPAPAPRLLAPPRETRPPHARHAPPPQASLAPLPKRPPASHPRATRGGALPAPASAQLSAKSAGRRSPRAGSGRVRAPLARPAPGPGRARCWRRSACAPRAVCSTACGRVCRQAASVSQSLRAWMSMDESAGRQRGRPRSLCTRKMADARRPKPKDTQHAPRV